MKFRIYLYNVPGYSTNSDQKSELKKVKKRTAPFKYKMRAMCIANVFDGKAGIH